MAIDYHKLVCLINFIAKAHQNQINQFGKTERTLLNGEKVPYFTHPLWTSLMILLEPSLAEKIRWPGAIALLFHDVLEDTTASLPVNLDPGIVELIQKMTVVKEPKFHFSSFEKERLTLSKEPVLVQLLKLYDKVATLYDGALPKKRYLAWVDLTEKLIRNVEKEYGALNIVLLARQLTKKYRDLAQKPS